MTAAGLTEGVTSRRLFILRTDDWSTGARTREVVEALEKAGGLRLAFPPGDIRILVALRDLLKNEDIETVQAWCAQQRPARDVDIPAGGPGPSR